MKLKRSKVEDWGCAGGMSIFHSSFFDVVVMRSKEKGLYTTLEIRGVGEKIFFDGKHTFKSDKKCFEQLTFPELKALIKAQRKDAFRAGEDEKAFQLRKLLEYH